MQQNCKKINKFCTSFGSASIVPVANCSQQRGCNHQYRRIQRQMATCQQAWLRQITKQIHHQLAERVSLSTQSSFKAQSFPLRCKYNNLTRGGRGKYKFILKLGSQPLTPCTLSFWGLFSEDPTQFIFSSPPLSSLRSIPPSPIWLT